MHFSTVDFNQIKIKIKNKRYKLIGSGSGRRVFDLENGYVVKVAKNKKGIAQNKAEYKISLADNSNIFAKITEVSSNYKLLIMEKAEKIDGFAEIWDYYNVNSNSQLFRIEDLKDISSKHDLLIPDLIRYKNWGKVNGVPVIIDYGFTEKVRQKYYGNPFFRYN